PHCYSCLSSFPLHDAPPPCISPLSLHDALPISFSPREPSHERSNHPNLRPRLRADIPRHRRARSSGRRQHHAGLLDLPDERLPRSEEHTSESSHVKISYAVFCLKKKKTKKMRER